MLSTRILQLTDLHVFRDPDARLRGIPTFQLLCDVVEHIKQSGEEFDFVVVNDDFGQAVADLQAILAGRGDALRGGRSALTPLLADLLADPLAD